MMLEIVVKHALGAFLLDAAFTAPAGVTAIFGTSGSGKTSILRSVAGLSPIDQGRIAVTNDVLYDTASGVNVAPHQRRIGYVFQDARLFPHMSVRQNLRFGGTFEEDRTVKLLGLDNILDRRPVNLSGGEQQRVAIGRALMSNPRLLLLDEPLASLDALRKAEVLPYLERLRDEMRLPMLYVSHDLSEVARLATTLVLLDQGQVRCAGPLQAMLSDPKLMPQFGVRAAGSVLRATVAGVDADDALTTLDTSAGQIILPGQLGAVGQKLRLRIIAQDVILAQEAPAKISALNVLPATIARLETGQGPGVAVVLQAGDEQILARVTRRSAKAMGLAVGQDIFAIIKATAIAPADVGRARKMD